MYDINQSPLMTHWEPYRGKFTFLPRFLLLLVVVYGANLLSGIFVKIANTIVNLPEIIDLMAEANAGTLAENAFTEQLMNLLNTSTLHPAAYAVSLIGQVFLVGGVVIYILFVERRSLRSVGIYFDKLHTPFTLLAGGVIGAALPLVAVAICRILDTVTIAPVWANGGWLVLFFVAFFVQAFAESFLYRGYFLSLFLRPGRSPWTGILLISLFHVLPQIGAGMNAFSFINAALTGLILTVLTVRTGSVWLSSSFVAMWNTITFSVFGGGQLPSVWRLWFVSGHDLVSGGPVGIDSGLVMTLLLLITLMLTLFLPSWKHTQVYRNEFDI